MSPLDEKDLDRLSAEAAEHYHAPGNPSWESLEQVLDIELPQKKEKRRRGLFFFLLFAGLFISGAAWWHFRAPSPADNSISKNGTKITPAGANTTSNTTNSTNDNVATGTAGTATKTTTITTPGTTSPAIKAPLTGNDKPAAAAINSSATNNTTAKTTNKKAANTIYPSLAATTPVAEDHTRLVVPAHRINTKHLRDKLVTAPGDETLANGKQKAFNKGHKITPAQANPVAKTGEEATAAATTGNGNTTGSEGNSGNQQLNPPVNTTAAASPAGDKAGAPAPDSAVTAKTATTPPVTNPETTKATDKKKKPAAGGKALSIGVTGGVDMSTVRFSYGDNAGYNIGLMGGYHFNKHWSVYTGAIYTKKNYKLDGYDYHLASNANPNYSLETVEGYCRMWEVPVLGRYTFNSHTSARLFVSGGLSSYFMEQEHYNYNYKYNGMPGSRAWTNNASSNYWFSILDLSAGVEKQLGKHLIGQIEPYAKLPLAGLGFGKIKMSSFGLNLTLQYRKKIGK